MPLLIAHRGASSEAPENTLSAIRKAIEYSVDLVEFDVHLSRDGIPVVLHDSHIDRTTNSHEHIHIEDLDLKAIKQLDAGSWFDPAYKDERIPTLEEVLNLKRNGVGLMIELKRGNAEPKTLVKAIIATLNKVGIDPKAERILIGTFSFEIINELKIQAPEFPIIGNVYDDHLVPELLAMEDLSYAGVWYKHIDANLIRNFHESGKEVWAFTVDDVETVRFLLSIHTKGIITNDPARMKTILHLQHENVM